MPSSAPTADAPTAHAPAAQSSSSAPDISQSDTYEAADFDPVDFLDVNGLFSEEAQAQRDAVRAFITNKVEPQIEAHAHDRTFPKHLIPEFARLGLIGPHLPTEYGGGGHSNVVYGLMMQEVERCDSGLRSFCSVMGSLVMYPIWRYGSEAQKQQWLPALAQAEKIGCFGLTEPNHGSNPGGMETRAVKDGDHYVLNGHKRWSTNASIGDVAVIWAKDEDDVVRGFLVELDRPGVETPPIDDTWSLRAAVTSEIILNDVKVPKGNRLPEARGLGAPLSCLTQARFGIAWGVVGAAQACYDAARQHATNRKQFGKPIGQFQLIQERLVEMAQSITSAQLMNWRLATLKDEGSMRPQQVSMAKRNNCEMALEVARSARQVLGGDGVTSRYPVMRHMANLESVITYEGTHEVHTLVVGQDLTGLNAFSA